MGCLIGAMTLHNETTGELSYGYGLWVKTTILDIGLLDSCSSPWATLRSKVQRYMCGLMVKLCLILYWNGVIVTLKLIYQIKATQRITGLLLMRVRIHLWVWHLDVGLSLQKSVLGLLVGVLIPLKGTWAGFRTMEISLVYIFKHFDSISY